MDGPCPFSVKIRVQPLDLPRWELKMTIACNGLSLTVAYDEPYSMSYDAWMELIDDTGPEEADDDYGAAYYTKFSAENRRSGGGVLYLNSRAPRHIFRGPLRAAIERARALGLMFACSACCRIPYKRVLDDAGGVGDGGIDRGADDGGGARVERADDGRGEVPGRCGGTYGSPDRCGACETNESESWPMTLPEEAYTFEIERSPPAPLALADDTPIELD
jgi:hypothetical protein